MKADELLSWYLEMGVDEAIGETKVNHLAVKKEPPQPQQTAPAMPKEMPATLSSIPQNPMPAPAPIKGPIEAVRQARQLADNANSLEALREAVMQFDGCALKKTATNTVFSDGSPTARVMLLGEAPGANEDQEGIPFCGASGKLQDKILACIGLDRKKNLYITNNLFWRPPGNRRPTPEELAMCAPFVEKHIALMNPELLILAGSTSASALLGTKQGITGIRGKFLEYTNGYLKGKMIPVMATFHPSYLLRQPSQKKLVWQDMLEIKAFLESKGAL